MAGKVLLINYTAPLKGDALLGALEAHGAAVAQASARAEEIGRQAAETDVFLLFAGDFVYSAPDVLQTVRELCLRDGQLLCVAGYRDEITAIEAALPKGLVERGFVRPFEAMDQIAGQVAAMAAEQAVRKGQKSILLVDDDDVFLEMMQKWLSSKYRVTAVRSGEQALTCVASHAPDLILLDYEMPEPAGPQVMERLREMPAAAGVPVVFLTGKCDERSAESAARLDPDGYLLKAAGKERVLDFVEQLFAKKEDSATN